MKPIEKNKTVMGVFVASAVALAVMLSAERCQAQPSPGVEGEDWGVLSEEGAATVSYGVDAVSVDFAARDTLTRPTAKYRTISVCVGTQSPLFTGNYTDSGVTGVGFSLAGVGEAKPGVMVTLVGKNDLTWYNSSVELSEVDGEWQPNNISFEYEDGWYRDAFNTEANWNAALTDVKSISVYIMQSGNPAQTGYLKSFRLLNAQQTATTAGTLTARVLAWFGVENERDADRGLDSDGDGISDYLEITMTETDPGDANSVLKVDVQRLAVGLQLKWVVATGRLYDVYRCENLGSDFIVIASRIEALSTGILEYNDLTATGAGPYFYRVKQVQ